MAKPFHAPTLKLVYCPVRAFPPSRSRHATDKPATSYGQSVLRAMFPRRRLPPAAQLRERREHPCRVPPPATVHFGKVPGHDACLPFDSPNSTGLDRSNQST